MDAGPVRDELALVGWDARALDAGVALRHTDSGYLLEGTDGRRFAWLGEPASCGYAPEAITAAGVLGFGRAQRLSRRLVVVDEGNGAELVTIVPYRLRRGASFEAGFGQRLRLDAPLLRRDWRVRDESGSTVLRVTSRRKEAARMMLEGDPQAGLDLPVVLAVAYAVLLADELAAWVRANYVGPQGGA